MQTGQTFPHLPLLSPSKWGSPGPNVREVSPGLRGDASVLARVRSPPDLHISRSLPDFQTNQTRAVWSGVLVGSEEL